MTPIALNPQSKSGTSWLLSAKIIWVATTLITLALFFASVPIVWANLQVICAGSACLEGQLLPKNEQALREFGFSLGFYATYFTILIVVFTGVFVVIGTVIFWRKSSEWLILFLSLTLITFGASFPRTLEGLAAVYPALGVLVMSLDGFSFTSLFLLFYLFPDGHFVPGWTRWLAAGWVAIQLIQIFFPGSPWDPNTWPDLLTLTLVFGFFGSFVFAQIYRYRRVSSPVQRQQTKWIVFGMITAIVGFIGAALPGEIFPWLIEPGASGLLHEVISSTVYIFCFILIPLTIGIAILRYRLWDIDLIIHRTLVYGVLTASVVGLYILVVTGLGVLFQTGGRSGMPVSLIATAIVAVLFAPLRDRLQRGVNRLLYGQRDDPYAVLSHLGQQLEATLAPDAILPAIVNTIKEALKLPYAAITLDQEGIFTRVAAGTSAPDLLSLPLLYQGEAIGQLVFAPRAPTEEFTPAEWRLLNDLAHQAGMAAAAVRLTADLQHSRERLVTTREEERRRLRRDLHDGLGPALAAHTLKIGSARALLIRNPAAADALLAELESDIQTALTDIRRLVYNLRPPSLDELGLIGAIRESTTRYGRLGDGQLNEHDAGHLHIVVAAPEHLPPLPAAVEVAAYRIVQEALTNVVRHAQAQTCHIYLSLDEMLRLEISDDGIGLPPEHHTGVGLASMRERAQELGGMCQIETGASGVRVVAQLPLPPKKD